MKIMQTLTKQKRIENSIDICFRTIHSIEITGGDDKNQRIELVQKVIAKRQSELERLKRNEQMASSYRRI